MPKFFVEIRIGKDKLNKWQEEYVFEKCNNWNYEPTSLEKIFKESYEGFLK
jgi:hypothetical protein